MSYVYSDQITIDDHSDHTLESFYNQGYVFTRLGRGVMNQVRSLRVNLEMFELSSENKRVLKKAESVVCSLEQLPYHSYHWSIGKMASDFYSTKFGEGIMSANKIKELFTDPKQSNMNAVFVFREQNQPVGHCLAYQSSNIIHYSYPFYSLTTNHNSLGIAMMTKAILYAREHNKTFVYLGSVHDKKSLYKLQFKGLEWWDNDHWNNDLDQLKTIASSARLTSSME